MSSTVTTNNNEGSSRISQYNGVRRRKNGKWVSEIREPGSSERIWLGTYPIQEMAAAAYDVATLALKGKYAILNFPESASSFPIPASLSAQDIKVAAAGAAAAMGATKNVIETQTNVSGEQERQEVMLSDFMDEDLIFDTPDVFNMTQQALLNPPHFHIGRGPDSLEEFQLDLWNFP